MTDTVEVNDRGFRIGEDHNRAKLTNHDVDLIRQLYADGMSCRQIAEKFDVTFAHVAKIASFHRRNQLFMGVKPK